jgi:nucleoside-diphosphate-sugar epimerase
MSKRVLLTGARGFVGHALVQQILDVTDWHIICANRTRTSNLDRLAEVINDSSRVSFVEYNVRDSEIPVDNINIVLHAGGNPSAADCLVDPNLAIQDNIIGTINLLNWARTQPIERFVLFSTAEVFGPGQGRDFSSTDRFNSNNPYAASKAAAEELCSAYQVSYGVPCMAVRLVNTFGPRCQPERFPVLAIRNMLQNSADFKIHTNHGKISSRRWFHIDDMASQVLFLLQLENYQPELSMGRFNLAGPKEINNLELLQMISDATGKSFNYELVPSDRSGHDITLPISPDLIYQLGWSTPYTVEERIQQTVDWYRNNQKWLQ